MNTTLRKITLIFHLFILCNDISSAVDSLCGDWEVYKDDKCLKIIDDTLRSHDDAVKTCNLQEATLLAIHTKEEQDYLTNFLFNSQKILENIWIGAKNNNSKFKWTDDSDVDFTNWMEGYPKNLSGYDCVQMIPEQTGIGKWVNEPCAKRGYVVCQKMQNWSLTRLQNSFLNIRKEFKDYVVASENKFNNIKQNPVPIGFIYVQLPNQPDPKSLWEVVEWKDVTSEYAGLFFRAEGGSAAEFGKEQIEDCPKLSQVDFMWGPEADSNYIQLRNLIPGQWTQWTRTGGGGSTLHQIRFFTSSAEVRPRNKAMRIWKRIK